MKIARGFYNRRAPSRLGATSGEAFTLIELLVVIAVIAVLASLLLPALSLARERGLRVRCVGNHRQLALAWSAYRDDNHDALALNSDAAPGVRIGRLKGFRHV